MKRRETLKALMVGTVGGAAIGTTSCNNINTVDQVKPISAELYGRTPSELEWDQKINSQIYFEDHELNTIATLCDIILPATTSAGSATDAEVPDFVEFIVKDLPDHQLPLRGGLMWLDALSNQRYQRVFVNCSDAEQISIIDDIAYPDPGNKKPDMAPGIKFFDRMRNLTLTGYYTSKMGLKDLGYKGNIPNIWDGVPDDVLKDHDVSYETDWLAKCIDQSKREDIAEWDDKGNLIT